MVTAIKGNVSDDPRVEEEFEADPLTYKGKLRISTGLAIVAGIEDLAKKAHLITCPLTIHHGANDRVTDPNGSKMFFEKVATPPEHKSIKIWPGYEHGELPPSRPAFNSARLLTSLFVCACAQS